MMESIRQEEEKLGGPDQLGKGPPLGPSHPPILLTLGVPGGTVREGVDIRGAAQSFGPWDPSINDDLLPFSEGVVFLDGGKGTVGGSNLLSG